MYALTMLLMLPATGAPSPADALSQGVAAAAQQDWDAAHKRFSGVASGALASDSNSSLATAARIAVAESLFQQGRTDEAAIPFAMLYETRRAATRAAHDLIVLRWAQCLAHQEQWLEAAQVAETALGTQLDPLRQIQLRYLLGRCHSALGSHLTARSHYLQVIRSAQSPEALAVRSLWMIAHTYAKQGELETARETFLRIEQRAQPTPALAARALIEAGRCSERSGQWAVAEKTYRQAVAKYATTETSNEARRRLAVVQIRREPARR